MSKALLRSEDCTNALCVRNAEEQRLEMKRLRSSVEELKKIIGEKDREIDRYRNDEKEAKKTKEAKEVEVNSAIFVGF